MSWYFKLHDFSFVTYQSLGLKFSMGFIMSLIFRVVSSVSMVLNLLNNYSMILLWYDFWTYEVTWLMLIRHIQFLMQKLVLVIRIWMKFSICDTSLRSIMVRADRCHVSESHLCHLVFMTGYLMRTLPPLYRQVPDDLTFPTGHWNSTILWSSNLTKVWKPLFIVIART